MKTALHPSPTQTAAGQPNWIDQACERLARGLLERFDRSPMEVTFPDGRTECYGKTGSGAEPARLQIHHPRLFRRVLKHGEIGLGEGYMDGDWSTPDLTRLLSAFIDNLHQVPGMAGGRRRRLSFHALKWVNRIGHWKRRNNRENSRRNIRDHYDLSNEFYALWLDESLTYSSAWFEGPESLRKAQENKYDRLCRKLGLTKGMRVLEIGCGWGGFALHAAHNYGVSVTAITLSEAQHAGALERVRNAGLEDRVEVLLCDYRDVRGSFDAIVSIEMLEAVGHSFLKAFFGQCHRLLGPEGRLGLQVIVCPDCRYEAMRHSVDWIKKHIFPGGQLPSVKALVDSTCATGDLYLQHLESFGMHYARTLSLWRERFNRQREAVLSMGFDERFLRKWNYYLSYCEAAFATRNINVAQMILARPNNTGFVPEA